MSPKTSPLVSTSKVADSSLRPTLHPLVLLTISDYITRHTLQYKKGPIVGALLGQQTGREVSIEHAFELQNIEIDGQVQLHKAFFEERLQQYKDVHKHPPLELVGWWTVTPRAGPGHEVLGCHKNVMEVNESALMLAFHPSEVAKTQGADVKLPLTVYETVTENRLADVDGDKMMDGAEGRGEELDIKFRELTYEITTVDAEMIGIDFVAKGAGNATAIDEGSKKKAKAEEEKGKGKERACEPENESENLTAEEEELIASLTTRANAIRMLQSRLSSIRSYLTSLPPSYLNDSSLQPAPNPVISHPILRSILALTARLPLLIPANSTAFDQQQLAERTDVALVELLGGIGQSVAEARETGIRFGIIEQGKKHAVDKQQRAGKGMMGFGMNSMSGGPGSAMDWTDGGSVFAEV